eukprot:Hpha_TRINITY_DN16444_c0_g10::TRINITY_DN16444_c0_g10_i1::g.161861::m.161861
MPQRGRRVGLSTMTPAPSVVVRQEAAKQQPPPGFQDEPPPPPMVSLGGGVPDLSAVGRSFEAGREQTALPPRAWAGLGDVGIGSARQSSGYSEDDHPMQTWLDMAQSPEVLPPQYFPTPGRFFKLPKKSATGAVPVELLDDMQRKAGEKQARAGVLGAKPASPRGAGAGQSVGTFEGEEQSTVLNLRGGMLLDPRKDPAKNQMVSRTQLDSVAAYCRRPCVALRPGSMQVFVPGGAMLATGREGNLPEMSEAGKCSLFDAAPGCGARDVAVTRAVTALFLSARRRAAAERLTFNVATHGQWQAELNAGLLQDVALAYHDERCFKTPITPVPATYADLRALSLRHAADTLRLMCALWGSAGEAVRTGDQTATVSETAFRLRELTAWLANTPGGAAPADSASELVARGRAAEARKELSEANELFAALFALVREDPAQRPKTEVQVTTHQGQVCPRAHPPSVLKQWRLRLRQSLGKSRDSLKETVSSFLRQEKASPPQVEGSEQVSGTERTPLQQYVGEIQGREQDACAALLALWAEHNNTQAPKTELLASLASPLSWSTVPSDCSLNWFLALFLGALGVAGLPEERLARQLAHQLEAEGSWQWAVVVLLTLRDDAQREQRVRQVLARRLPSPRKTSLPEGLSHSGTQGSLRLTLPSVECGDPAGAVELPEEWVAAALRSRCAMQQLFIKDELRYIQ